MPRWEGIEDASAQAPAVWLSRKLGGSSSSTTVSASWKPLRKADCLALNKNNDNSKVYIEGGRSTADPVKGLIRYNFFRGHDRELCSAVWFVKEEKGKDTILHPVTDVADSVLMETLYQKAVEATSSLGKGISSVLDEVLLLRDGESKIQVNKSGDVLTMRKVPSGWFKNSLVLQRGYGEYKIPGEETELALGPVKHLVFVVHGIGEALFSREEIKVTGLIEQTHTARMELQRKQLAAWKKDCEKADKAGTAKPPPPARIELIPIEWFNRMHDSSSALMRSLKATTLNTIPALRAIANDVVFDVLMYLTPAFCEGVLETVTEQINDVYSTFQVVHPDFLQSGGKCSLAGHSLGSVICWDLLAVLKQSKPVSPLESTCGVSVAGKAGYQAYAQAEHADKAQNGTYGPSLNKPMKQTIPFVPEHTLFLGSPLGIFLTLRGAHPVFDEMRLQAKRSEETSEVPSVSPFTLPTKSLYNIFHPSDPVAYRIEPLLMSQDVNESDVPPPMYLTVPGQDVRLHVRAMQLGDVVRKSFFDQKKGGWGSLLESAVSAVGNQSDLSSTGKRGEGDGRTGALTFPLGGTSSRVDFCLQPGVVDSEYISAVTAHSTYFTNSDIQDFVIGLLAATEERHT